MLTIAINNNMSNEKTPLINNNHSPATSLSGVKNLTGKKSDLSYPFSIERICYRVGRFISGIVNSFRSLDKVCSKYVAEKDENGRTNLHRAVTDKSYITAAFFLGFLHYRLERILNEDNDEKMLDNINPSEIDESTSSDDQTYEMPTFLEHIVDIASEKDPSDISFYTGKARKLIERGAIYDIKLAVKLFKAGIKAQDTKLVKVLMKKGGAVKLFKEGIKDQDTELLKLLIDNWKGGIVPYIAYTEITDNSVRFVTAFDVAVAKNDMELKQKLLEKVYF